MCVKHTHTCTSVCMHAARWHLICARVRRYPSIFMCCHQFSQLQFKFRLRCCSWRNCNLCAYFIFNMGKLVFRYFCDCVCQIAMLQVERCSLLVSFSLFSLSSELPIALDFATISSFRVILPLCVNDYLLLVFLGCCSPAFVAP